MSESSTFSNLNWAMRIVYSTKNQLTFINQNMRRKLYPTCALVSGKQYAMSLPTTHVFYLELGSYRNTDWE